MDLHLIRSHVEKWLEEAGKLAVSISRHSYTTMLKDDHTPVTEADHVVEIFLREQISEAFPDHSILGEEYGKTDHGSAYTWLIDPIDGTRAFMAGFPTFTILLALLEENRPNFGAIYQPVTGECWLGHAGSPTLMNAEAIKTRDCQTLEEAVFSTTSPLLFEPKYRPVIEAFLHRCKATQLGGDAYAYGKLAAGSVNIIIESGLKPHDFMPLIPIIEGAGGLITDWNGKPLTLESSGNICAAGGKELHRLALESLQTAG